MDISTAMRRDYESGMTLREVGEKHHYCHSAARIHIIKAGGHMRGKGTRKNKAMMMHDWNADKPVSQMVRTYGYASYASMYQMIRYWRKRGWAFKRRRP